MPSEKFPRGKRICAYCNGDKWGLARYEWFGQQYCSKRCYDAAENMRNRVREFLKFLSQ